MRLMIGFGFAAHGYAKLSKGPDGFAAILQTLGIPAPGVMAWLTALSELFGGLALKAGALVPIVSVPLAIIMLFRPPVRARAPRASLSAPGPRPGSRARPDGRLLEWTTIGIESPSPLDLLHQRHQVPGRHRPEARALCRRGGEPERPLRTPKIKGQHQRRTRCATLRRTGRCGHLRLPPCCARQSTWRGADRRRPVLYFSAARSVPT
ncbi:MAG: DoxX family protein [Acidobacteria bacterium]|nr:DoxX family protein [Acidobacteriota bacterium]